MRRFLPLLLTLPALCHPLYLLPQKFQLKAGDKILVSINNGDSFPASDDGVDPARLKTIKVDGGSHEDFRRLGKTTFGFIALHRPGTRYIYAATMPNQLELPADQFETYLKLEGLTHVSTWRAAHGEANKPGRERFSKYAKSLVIVGAPDDGYKSGVGAIIEIMPLADPAALAPGRAFPVTILFRGKPAAGLQVGAAWAAGAENKSRVIGRTDAEGKISVFIDKAGAWRLMAVTMERCTDTAAADWESYWASLTFEVKSP